MKKKKNSGEGKGSLVAGRRPPLRLFVLRAHARGRNRLSVSEGAGGEEGEVNKMAAAC